MTIALLISAVALFCFYPETGLFSQEGQDDMQKVAVNDILGNITEYGDVWGATNAGAPPFEDPYRRGWLGYLYDPAGHWTIYDGEVNGMGGDDIVQITEYGDAWVSVRNETLYETPTRWGWLGFRYEESETQYGHYPLIGDVDGDGDDDLIQVTEYTDAWTALANETMYDNPTRWGWIGFRFQRPMAGENGEIPLACDVNGDGLTDLVQITRYTDAWVALSNGSGYDDPTRWGWLGFSYDPQGGYLPMCGDVTGDGKDDLLQVTPYGDLWVAPADDMFFGSVTQWTVGRIYYHEAYGLYPIVADVNSDGIDDVIQITIDGDPIVNFSNGSGFEPPESWGRMSFFFDRFEGYLPLYLDY